MKTKLAYFGLGGLFVAIGYLLATGVGGMGSQAEMSFMGWSFVCCGLCTLNGQWIKSGNTTRR